MKNWGTQWTIEISSNEKWAPMAIEKIKIVGAVLELPAKQHCQFSPFGPSGPFSPFGPIFEGNGLAVLFSW